MKRSAEHQDCNVPSGYFRISRYRKYGILTVAMLALVHLLMLIYTSRNLSATNDEPAHLVAGLSYLDFEQFGLYRVNPPLVRLLAAAPVVLSKPERDWTRFTQSSVVRAEFKVGRDFATANGQRFPKQLQLARYAVMPFSVMGLLGCYVWSRSLWKESECAGILSAALWGFSPSIVGHGSLVGCDVPAAALGIWLGFTFSRLIRARSFDSAFACGVVWGFALLTKSTWLLFGPLLWLHACVEVVRHQSVGAIRTAVFISALALLVLNTGYLFHGTGTRLGDIQFVSDELTVKNGNVRINRFTGTWISDLPMLVPLDFVLGVDIQHRDIDVKTGGYMAGTVNHRGRWYYPLYALLVKMPTPFLILVMMSLIPSYRLWRTLSAGRWALSLGAIVFLVVLCTSRMDDHFRYLIPALPFTFVWMGSLHSTRHWAWVAGVGGLLLAYACVTVAAIPNTLSFFNSVSGGPSKGYHHLLGSNLDWGQGLVQLTEWVEEHEVFQPILLAYHGPLDPSIYGVWWYPLPEVSSHESTPPPGVYAISENLLFGDPNAWLAVPDAKTRPIDILPFCDYFRHTQPDARCGPIRVYRIKSPRNNALAAP